jgi:nucleoid-associated protein YgaU
MSDFGVGGMLAGGIDAGFQASGISAAIDAASPAIDGLLGGLKLFEAYNPFSFVTFDYNPSSFEVSRKSFTRQRPNSTDGAGGNTATTVGTWATKVTFKALLTEEDSGSAGGAIVDAVTGQGVINRATTLMNWATTGGDKSLLAMAGAAVLGAAASVLGISMQQPSTRPLLLLQWGDPIRGHLMLGMLDSTTISYKRFSSTGNPTRAEVTCTFIEVKNKLLSALTNPTSGGVAGRRGHTLTQGESLQGIATENYGRPAAWRTLADTNGIDDPLRVKPGQKLLMPPYDQARG